MPRVRYRNQHNRACRLRQCTECRAEVAVNQAISSRICQSVPNQFQNTLRDRGQNEQSQAT
jgi:hypothetical protein